MYNKIVKNITQLQIKATKQNVFISITIWTIIIIVNATQFGGINRMVQFTYFGHMVISSLEDNLTLSYSINNIHSVIFILHGNYYYLHLTNIDNSNNIFSHTHIKIYARIYFILITIVLTA